ncbi:MAG TPA: hypothetical protein VFO34_10505 [Candidatus Acidoferrales bacterium]|nr:hypothetical protein [Candidatus Acidoferrales bacterium]
MRAKRWLVVKLPSLVLIATSVTMAETPVKMADLPPAVQNTVKQQMAGATLRGLSKETEHGKTTYEAELIVNGTHKDVTIDADGKIIEVEEEVQLASIPEAARNAIQAAAGKSGKVLKVESVTEGDKLVAYEAQIQKTPNGKRSEVRVDAAGKPAPEH